MPFTFSHPAAILPIHSRFKNWIPLSALVIGSLVPDAAYYLPTPEHFRTHSHTLLGTFSTSLPFGYSRLAHFLLARSVGGVSTAQPAPRGYPTAAQASQPFHTASLGRRIGRSDRCVEPCSMGFVHSRARLDRAPRSTDAKTSLRKRAARVQRPAILFLGIRTVCAVLCVQQMAEGFRVSHADLAETGVEILSVV